MLDIKLNNLYNVDCMIGMSQFPDKYFDIAIVDPPYGGAHKDSVIKICRTGGTWQTKYNETHIKQWDIAPLPEYFTELFRISKNQIIFGGNHFNLPPTRCFIVWDKMNISETFTTAMCEYAWTSFNSNAKIVRCVPQGTAKDKRFHPTQKPIKLYQWILQNYAKQGDKIIDTHAGSASSLIAAHYAKIDYIGFEINKTFFDKACKRLSEHTRQLRL